MKSYYIIVIVLFFSFAVNAQQDKLTIEVSAYGGGATDSLQPLWNYANQWGTFSPLTKGEGVLSGKVYFHFLDKKNISMRAGVAGVAKTDFSESFIQEAFLRMKFWWFDVSGGMEAYSPVSYNDKLTSGMFLVSSNARPVPRVTAGIFEYLPLGFTKNWVEIRGGMSQGFLLDDRGAKGNTNVLLHEKWAYLRLGNVKLKPYAGIVHSALFGGTRPNGEKIPIDFLATFLGSASKDLGETNATGAHMGLWDFGLYFPVKSWAAHLYYQKPFADGSGMGILHFRNKDFYLGVIVKNERKELFSGISLEYIKTSWQTGPGTPDPLYPADYDGHKQGEIIWFDDINDDLDDFMHEVFGEPETGWTESEVKKYLEVNLNKGFKFGGRDDYMNNGQYYAGWTNHGMSMGIPLFHTADQTRLYAKGWNLQDRMYFINNRINGFHVGIEGWLRDNVFYRVKGTYTNNRGSYGEQYYGRYSWEETPGYFFSDSKNQFYTGMELNWQLKRDLPLTLTANLGLDFGELYNSFGGRMGVVYRWSVK
jgi:hypothetical protein